METRVMLQLNIEGQDSKDEFKDNVIECINYFEEAIRLINNNFPSITRNICDDDKLGTLDDFVNHLNNYKNNIEDNILWDDDEGVGGIKPKLKQTDVGGAGGTGNTEEDNYCNSKFIGSDDPEESIRCYFEVNDPLDEIDEILLEVSNIADGEMYIEAYDAMDDKYSSYSEGEHDSGDY